MSHRLSIAALLTATLLLGFEPSARALCVEPGQVAPDFTARNLGGEAVSLSDYRGRVVLLAFWSSWCSRCQEELAFLQELEATKKTDLVILAVNQEAEELDHQHVAAVHDRVSDWQIPFPVLLDEGLRVWGQYCLNALPTSVVVDREGRVHFAEPNFYWASEENLTRALSELGVL